jgi:TonB family protein
LQGRVAVRFVIAPSGLVQRAAVESSNMSSAALEQCVARAVERFVFDAPSGSGIVSVSYPFLFQHTGS